MNVGIIGFGQSGKSTVYRAAAQSQAKGDVTAVPVPDGRFDQIVNQINPKKATPATVIFHDDIESIQGGGTKMFSQRFLDQARKADVLLHVVRAFDSPMSPYHDDVNPIRDVENVDVELVLSDLAIIESRLERLAKMQQTKQAGSPEYGENAFLGRIKPIIEEGTPIRALELTEDEQKICRNYQFLSAKQTVVAFNVGEDNAAEAPEEIKKKIEELKSIGTEAFSICAMLEEEVSQLDAEDQPEFLSALGLKEPANKKVVQAIYDALGLITFFTAGESETRAWALKRGGSALKAADTIHSDIARGFIRAEIVSFDDYNEAGSWDAALADGKMKLEGKEYVIQDGDLLHIRNKS